MSEGSAESRDGCSSEKDLLGRHPFHASPTNPVFMKHIIPFLCAVFLLPVLATAGEKFPEIDHADLMKAVEQKGATIIDVNGSESYAQGHIPGAVDYMQVKGDLAKALPEDKDALVVAYCGSEKCGAYAKAAKAAKELGYNNVKHYKPGIAGWKEKDAPIEKTQS